MNGWREVSKEDFYSEIGPQNVSPTVDGKWPYTSRFVTPRGDVRGICEDYLPEGSGLTESRYFLPPNAGNNLRESRRDERQVD